MSLLLQLLQGDPAPPPEQTELDAAGGGGSVPRRSRNRAVPGWAVPMLNLQLEPTPEQLAANRAARTRRQLRTLRAMRLI